MDSVGRLLLRFVLVPLGYLVAVVAGTLVIVIASWQAGGGGREDVVVFGFVFAAPVLLVMLLATLWLPGAIGILIAEAFAIRSWMFHAANGAVTAWIGWQLFDDPGETLAPLNEPLAVIAAGLAGGFAYWAVAGWNAGFWKPVFRASPVPALPSPGAASPPPQIR
jgi:hypothetical protein